MGVRLRTSLNNGLNNGLRQSISGGVSAALAFLEYTTASVSSFVIKTIGTVNYDVDWGDGSTETGVTTNNKNHTYSTAGVYVIKITPAEGSTLRPKHYQATDYQTNLTKADGTGGSSLGLSLVEWLRGTTSLTSLGASLDVSQVTNFGRAWDTCSGLTTFPALDTSSGIHFSFAWSACSGLTSFPALDFSSAIDVGQAWNGCSNLVEFPSLDFSSVTSSFRRTWYNCTSLTTYPANQFDNNSSVPSNGFEAAWRGCALTAQSIENILTSLDTGGAQNITLGIQAGSNANASTWSYDALDAYVDLVNKGWTITQNGTPTIAYTINNSGTSFTLRSSGTVNYTVDWGDGSALETSTSNTLAHTYSSSGTYVVKINNNSGATYRPFFINSGDEDQIVSVVIAGAGSLTDLTHAFQGSANMTSYKQVSSVTSNVTSLSSSFASCSSLTSFPAIDASSVTSVHSAWKECTNLATFPAIDLSSTTQFYRGWKDCTSLTSFGLCDTSSGQTFGETWFNCSSLTSFPLIDTSSATNLNDTWRSCSSLTSFPQIDTSSVTLMSRTWRGCSSLTSFPQVDTSSVTLMNSTWQSCSSLTSFPLIDTSSVTDPRDAWNNCTGLTSFPALNLSSGGDFRGAWFNCSSLTSFPSITPTSGTDFGGAWRNCSSLTTYPANQFDTTGTLTSSAFALAFGNCALTAQSIENILTSLDTNGSQNVTLHIAGGTNAAKSTWSTAANTAYNNLVTKGWTISFNS